MNILLIDDQAEFGDYLTMLLKEDLGHQVTLIPSGQKALALRDEKLIGFEIALVDMMMPGIDGFETGLQLKRRIPHLVMIMLTGYPSIETVVKALRDCKFDDYLPKTELADSNDIRPLKEILIKAQGLLEYRKAHSNAYQLSNAFRSQTVEIHKKLIGQSKSFQQVRQLIENVALTESAVLITGETGTGKELVAREIHRKSDRRLQPFVPINCSAIPTGLLESEFFGHKKGAFTGAFENKSGFFQLADGGTLFLDEIGDMSLELQGHLLRVLQEQQFFPVGTNSLSDAIQVDVRILSATHQDLKQKIKEGGFRKDLLYRLNTITLFLPPLRERIADIKLLVHYFIAKLSKSKKIKGILPDALAMLRKWPWEGNVRELEHVIEYALIGARGEYLSRQDFSKEIQDYDATATPSPKKPSSSQTLLTLSRLSRNDESLWDTFENHRFKLWTINDDDFVREQLNTILKEAKYLKKGHFGRLVVAKDAELPVNIQYVSAYSCELEEVSVIFEFKSEQSFDRLPPKKNLPHKSNPSVVFQPVLRGLPDTYLFNILYPPPQWHEITPHFPQQMMRATILRYAQTHAPSQSLKGVFKQVMTFLIDQRMAHAINGLSKDGLEAMRAYLTGESHIFFGFRMPHEGTMGHYDLSGVWRWPDDVTTPWRFRPDAEPVDEGTKKYRARMEEKKPWFFKPEEFDEAMEKRDREYVRRLKVLYPDL